jgi:hypothetical protein
MSPRQAGIVAGFAFTIGIAGDLLLRTGPWGLNLPVWITLAVGTAAWFTARARGTPWWRESTWYLPAVFFAACVAWRDAEQLTAWNILGVLLTLLIPALRSRSGHLFTTPLGLYISQPFRTGLSVVFGPIVTAAEDIAWNELHMNTRSKRMSAIAIGIAIALPIALVFGSLLASADPVFDEFLRSLFDWDFASIVSHTLLTALLAWLTAGYLGGILGHGTPKSLAWAPPSRPRVGLVEIGIPLGVLVVLFTAFVAVQARYLFGGEAWVQTTMGLTYAEYARRGFFELIAVAGLLLPVLLAADWLMNPEDAPALRRFRALVWVLLLLAIPMVASALERMRLYVDAYGLSSDRIYALSVMTWVVLALAWFAFTVLRGMRDRCAFGAMVGGFAVLAALNVLNPDRTVARVNFARMDQGNELDVPYLADLSADGVSEVLAQLQTRGIGVPCVQVERIEERWESERPSGWRRWNLGRLRARQAVREMDAAWAARCQPGEPVTSAPASDIR